MDEQAEATLIDWIIDNYLIGSGRKEVSRSFEIGEDADLRIVVHTLNEESEKEKMTFRISTVSEKDFLEIRKQLDDEEDGQDYEFPDEE
jgi:hypothetical protein